ncbi:MAG: hypothetical protein ACXWI1_04655 [Croceibacterium sp.]
MAFRLGSGARRKPKTSRTGTGLSFFRAFPEWLAFLLLLGFVVQGTAIQTHPHFTQQPGSSLIASSNRAAPASKSEKDDRSNCPLCQEAAMAGAYLLPPAVVVPPPPAMVLWIVGTTLASFALLTAAHSWQSRAPPQ